MTREELKSKLPHGYAKVIAEKSGVNLVTVSRWLNGKSDNQLVELAVLEIVADLTEKKNSFLSRIK